MLPVSLSFSFNFKYADVFVHCAVMSDSATLWTVAHQAPLFMEFSRQGYWSGLPFPIPGDLSDPGIKPTSPALQADSLTLSHLMETDNLTLFYSFPKTHLTHSNY